MDNLRQIFGIDAKYETLDKKVRLPLYITERYEVQRILLGELWCIALTPIGEMETLPALKKQIRKIQEIENSPVFIRARRLSRFRCQNMIQNRIPFVTEKQIYLPFMGTYLEKMNDQLESLKQLTPSAQQLLLLYFYSETQKMYLSEAGKKLPVTAMTLTRAARQLEETNFFYITKDGVNIVIESKYDKGELYERMKTYMISPIKEKGYIERNAVTGDMILAGTSALAEKTTLNEGRLKTYAVYARAFDKKCIQSELIDPDRQAEVELWKYDPKLLASDGIADPVSVALSIDSNNDERVEDAVDYMINNTWRDLRW